MGTGSVVMREGEFKYLSSFGVLEKEYSCLAFVLALAANFYHHSRGNRVIFQFSNADSTQMSQKWGVKVPKIHLK